MSQVTTTRKFGRIRKNFRPHSESNFDLLSKTEAAKNQSVPFIPIPFFCATYPNPKLENRFPLPSICIGSSEMRVELEKE
jgi:hypothetical protein